MNVQGHGRTARVWSRKSFIPGREFLAVFVNPFVGEFVNPFLESYFTLKSNAFLSLRFPETFFNAERVQSV